MAVWSKRFVVSLQDGSLFSSSEFFFVKFVNFILFFIRLNEFFEVSKWWFGSSKLGDRFFFVFFFILLTFWRGCYDLK